MWCLREYPGHSEVQDSVVAGHADVDRLPGRLLRQREGERRCGTDGALAGQDIGHGIDARRADLGLLPSECLEVIVAELAPHRDNPARDVARTVGAADGDLAV